MRDFPNAETLAAVLPRYVIGEVIGRGAWGVVMGARHRDLDRDVAIKVLPGELVIDDVVRRRFVSEARLLATLDHPHVVRVHDYVEDDDVCALVMERLRGGTVAQQVRLSGPAPQRTTGLLVAALHGLEHAHQRGVLHRDVKPDNLMLSGEGLLKVTDFGIGILLGANAERLTSDGVSLGTPAYMAPEQIDESTPLGPATDVWSAGAVLYHLLAGEVPYAGRETVQASLMARLRDDPPELHAVAPQVPRGIAAVVMQALARDVDERFGRARELADALEDAGAAAWGTSWLADAGVRVHRTDAAPSGVVTTAVTTGHPVPPEQAARPRRRRRVVASALALAVVAAGVTTALVVGRDDPASEKAAERPPAADAGLTPRPGGLPPVPAGWPSTLPVVATLDPAYQTRTAELLPGAGAEFYFSGEPGSDTSWNFGPGSAATLLQPLLDTGNTPWLGYYGIRFMGDDGEIGSPEQLLPVLRSRDKMRQYWRDVRALLTQLGTMDDQVLPLEVEPGVVAFLNIVDRTQGRAPDDVPTAVASTGVPGLEGLPDTFAGWAQAWVALRDELAPNVRLGMMVEQWGLGEYLIPRRPPDAEIDAWVRRFGAFHEALGTRFDYLDVPASYGTAGFLDAQDPSERHLPVIPDDYDRLLRFVGGLVEVTGVPALLDDLPYGNTLMDVMNNTPGHWRDNRAQYFLGDDGFEHLTAFRDAGVIGLGFSISFPTADGTCPCDAMGDGRGVGEQNSAALTGSEEPADSVDDDGGYFARQVARYVEAGGLPLQP